MVKNFCKVFVMSVSCFLVSGVKGHKAQSTFVPTPAYTPLTDITDLNMAVSPTDLGQDLRILSRHSSSGSYCQLIRISTPTPAATPRFSPVDIQGIDRGSKYSTFNFAWFGLTSSYCSLILIAPLIAALEIVR